MTRIDLRLCLVLIGAGLFLAAAFSIPALTQEQEHSEEAMGAGSTTHDMADMDMDDMSNGDHQLTHEMIEELRAKIALYREYTDEEINFGMRMMGAAREVYVSDESVTQAIGVLALDHGTLEPGDTQLKNAYTEISKQFPTAIAFGMAMMGSSTIQSAVDKLVAAGAETIVVIPGSPVKHSSLVRQWHYIFGLREDSAYLDAPRVKTEAKIVMAQPPGDSPDITAILLDFAREVSTDPENEVVIIVSHGPEEREGENEKELALLAGQAEIIRQEGHFAEVRAVTLQDDAPSAIRAANVEKLRNWVETATNEGRRVLIVTNLLTESMIQKKIDQDLNGLTYEFNRKGLTLHPRFQDWIANTVKDALNES